METRATLLVVDNSPINLELMRSLFEPFGYTVVTARSVQDGLDLARLDAPDLILSDLHMPGMDGYAFFRLAHEDSVLRQIPFVFLSSTLWPPDAPQKALALGALRFIQRPIEPKDLVREVELCLGK